MTDIHVRFWSKVNKDGPVGHLGTPCWVWTAGLSKAGYGTFHPRHGETVSAHRYAYRLLVGDVDSRLDHRCRLRPCVNVDHLRPATNKENGENLSSLRSNNRSGIRGVHWNKMTRKWAGQVTHDGKAYWVGVFEDILEAEAAVIAKRLELFTYNELDRV